MRSSKSRSRSKSNRNRPSGGGNIVNRVFDSSGPEGKVRGTPQQIIDKYNQLTRDAQLSNDRVAAENFAQHAEHYTRMLAEAQREMDQRREQQDQQQRDRQPNQGNPGGNAGSDRDGSPTPDQRGDDAHRATEARRSEEPRAEAENRHEARPAAEAAEPDPAAAAPEPAPKRSRRRSAPKEDDVIDTRSDEDGGLVETPESKPKPKPRRARKPRSDAGDAAGGPGNGENQTVE